MQKFVLGIMYLAFLFSIVRTQDQPETNHTIEFEKTCATFTKSSNCVKLGKKFYLINPSHKLNWFQAQRFCRQKNAHLALIENDAELNEIDGYLKGLPNTNGLRFWLAGTDLGSEGIFYEFMNGKPMEYFKWHPNQPDNILNGEDCVNLYLAGGKYLMNDEFCWYAKSFICEYDA